MPDLDAATEAVLRRPVQLYEIRPYIVWKVIVACSPEGQLPFLHDEDLKRAFLGSKRKLDRTHAIDWTQVLTAAEQQQEQGRIQQMPGYTAIHLKDEWLDIKSEARLSVDLFPLMESNRANYDAQNKVGHLVMYREDANNNNGWEDGVIVHQWTAVKQPTAEETRIARTRGQHRALPKQLTFYECMYDSGRVRWHTVEEFGKMDRVFEFADIDSYLRACNMDLQKWAGRFQHGLGTASPEATDDFVHGWEQEYALHIP